MPFATRKDTARLLVHQALQHPLYQDIETVVRINPLNTPSGLADLEGSSPRGRGYGASAETDSKEDIHGLEAHVERIERECGREVGSTKLMAAIESALGVVNAVGSPAPARVWRRSRWRPSDYVMDIGTSRGDGTELFYARCAVLHAARVAGASPPMTWCGRISITKRASGGSESGQNLGFNGKSRWLTHDKIELLHQVYARRAKRSITRWK